MIDCLSSQRQAFGQNCFINQQDDWEGGKAFAINDNDIIAGYATKRIEGSLRNKLFYHDINTNTTVFPEDYFISSSSYANDIRSEEHTSELQSR